VQTHCLIGYDLGCLAAACWLLHVDQKFLAFSLFVLSIVVWATSFGAQLQESGKESDARIDENTFD